MCGVMTIIIIIVIFTPYFRLIADNLSHFYLVTNFSIFLYHFLITFLLFTNFYLPFSTFFLVLFFAFSPPAQCIERYSTYKKINPTATATELRDELERGQRAFASLKIKDIPLIKVGVEFSDLLLPIAIENCSIITEKTVKNTENNGENSKNSGENVNEKSLKTIGVLAWFCLRVRPSVCNKFPLYLKALYESDNEVVDEVAIKLWHTATGILRNNIL